MSDNAKRGAPMYCVAFALASLLLAPLTADAQQPAKLARIGFLGASKASSVDRLFQQQFQTLGYTEGKTIAFEYRDAGSTPERLPEMAADLAQLKVDVIVAIANASAFAAKQATSTIPIVAWAHGAVESGMVQSLARPGANVTGVESLAPELDAKRIELLKEVIPWLTRLAVLHNAGDQGTPFHMKYVRAAGEKLGIIILPMEVRRPSDYVTALSAATAGKLDGLLMFTDPLTRENWSRVAEFASKHRLPTVCEFAFLARAGCMLAYGPTADELAQIAARQIDLILKGAKPAELPMQQPTRIGVTVNQKTAKTIGVTIPRSVLVRADEVIE